MDFFQSPNYSVNKRLLSCLGQWPLQTPKQRFFFRSTTVLLVGSIVLPKLIRFVQYFGDFNGMIQCMPVLGLHIVSVIKFLNCCINAKKLRKLTNQLKADWMVQSADYNNVILRSYAEGARQLTIYYSVYMFSTLWMYLLLPTVPIIMDIVSPLNQSRGRVYLYETQYFVDQDKYYFAILIHSYITMPFSVGIIIAFDTMFSMYVQHACGIFATLGARLEKIGSPSSERKSNITKHSNIQDRDEACENIVSCIKMHKGALEFANLIETTNSSCFVFVVGLCMLMVTLTGFMTVTRLDEPSDALRFGSFTLGEIIHMLYLCWQGQVLMEHSENIFINAYNVNWYNISNRGKRLLILIMMRSSVPCKITAGKIYILSLENFTAALKTSMSYFTVLLSMQE